jgi:hypothetical protein
MLRQLLRSGNLWQSARSHTQPTELKVLPEEDVLSKIAESAIECTDRDAAFVLDGLLYNESELEIEEQKKETFFSR